MSGRRLSALLWGAIIAVGAPGCRSETFACQEDSNCSAGGMCIEGSCAFASDDCESGLRFGEHAEAGLAGQCVVPMGSTGSDTTSTAAPVTSTSSVTTSQTTSSGSEVGSTTADETSSGTTFSAGTFGSSSSSSGPLETSTTASSSSSEGSSSSSSSSSGGGPLSCERQSASCAQCYACTGDQQGPCESEAMTCANIDGCGQVLSCYYDCYALGLCLDECCASATDEAVAAADEWLSCTQAICTEGCGGGPALCND